MSKIIITGATGFIGFATAKRLIEEGHSVYFLCRKSSKSSEKLSHLDGKVLNYEEMTEIPSLVAPIMPDVVIHLATHYTRNHNIDNVRDLIESNISFGTYLLESINVPKTQIILAQSFFQFDHGVSSPNSLYAATKQAFSEIARYHSSTKKLCLTELIFFETYGPGDSRDKLIPQLISCSTSGSTMKIQNRETLLNLVYIDDVVESILNVVENPVSGLYAVKPIEPVSIWDICLEFQRQAKKPFETIFLHSERSTNPNTSGNWPTPPGWKAKYNLEQGVNICIEGTT